MCQATLFDFVCQDNRLGQETLEVNVILGFKAESRDLNVMGGRSSVKKDTLKTSRPYLNFVISLVAKDPF